MSVERNQHAKPNALSPYVSILLLLASIIVLEVHGHTGGLDGDASLGLVSAVVSESRSTGLFSTR
jgi:hypothetical protein